MSKVISHALKDLFSEMASLNEGMANALACAINDAIHYGSKGLDIPPDNIYPFLVKEVANLVNVKCKEIADQKGKLINAADLVEGDVVVIPECYGNHNASLTVLKVEEKDITLAHVFTRATSLRTTSPSLMVGTTTFKVPVYKSQFILIDQDSAHHDMLDLPRSALSHERATEYYYRLHESLGRSLPTHVPENVHELRYECEVLECELRNKKKRIPAMPDYEESCRPSPQMVKEKTIVGIVDQIEARTIEETFFRDR